jgi:hypothetical protein
MIVLTIYLFCIKYRSVLLAHNLVVFLFKENYNSFLLPINLKIFIFTLTISCIINLNKLGHKYFKGEKISILDIYIFLYLLTFLILSLLSYFLNIRLEKYSIAFNIINLGILLENLQLLLLGNNLNISYLLNLILEKNKNSLYEYKGICNITDTQNSNKNPDNNGQNRINNNLVKESTNKNEERLRLYRNCLDLKYKNNTYVFPLPPRTYIRLKEEEITELSKSEYRNKWKSSVRDVTNEDMFYENPGDTEQDKSHSHPFFINYELKNGYNNRMDTQRDVEDTDIEPVKESKNSIIEERQKTLEDRLSNDSLFCRESNDDYENNINTNSTNDKDSMHSSKNDINLDKNTDIKKSKISPKSVTFDDVPIYINAENTTDDSEQKVKKVGKWTNKISQIFKKK